MAKKIELLHTTYDESGNIESQEVVHPLTSPDCIIMENGKTLDEVMGDGIATPTLTHEGTSFKVGVGDSNIEVVDGDVAGMTLKGQSYQNILPKPTTLIMETDEKEFKINDKIDSNIIIDDNIAEIATVKGKTIVNTVQEESGSEYTVLGEDLSGQSIVTTNKPEGNIKGVTLQGQTLVNAIQEPCKDDYVVLGADDGIEISAETSGCGTIEGTVQGGLNGAVLEGQTLKTITDGRFERSNNTKYPQGYQMDEPSVATFEDCGMYYKSTVKKLATINVNGEENASCTISFCETIIDNPIKIEKGKTYTLYIPRVDNSNYEKKLLVRDYSQTYNYTPIWHNQEYFVFTAIYDCTDIMMYQQFVIPESEKGKTVSVNVSKRAIIVEGDHRNEKIPLSIGMGLHSVQMPVVKTTGKNLFDGKLEKGLLDANTGKPSNNEAFVRSVNFIKVQPNKKYVISEKDDLTNFRVYEYDENFNYIDSTAKKTFTTESNTYYIKFRTLPKNSGDDVSRLDFKVMLETGDTATSYEPYQSSTISINNYVLNSTQFEQGTFSESSPAGTPYRETLPTGYMDIRLRSKSLFKIGGNAIRGTLNEGYGIFFGFFKDGKYLAKYSSWMDSTNFSVDVPYECTEFCIILRKNISDTINVSEYDLIGLTLEQVVELRGIGDVKDELDLQTGKLTQRIGEVVLDGNKEWSSNALLNNGIMVYMCQSYANGKIVTDNVVSSTLPFYNLDYLKGLATLDGLPDAFITTITSTGKINLAFKKPFSDLNQLKQYLSQNPITVQYELKTESIKTINLTVTNQNGNTIPHIKTQPTVTHITASSNYLIPTVTIDNNLAYDTIIKPSTLYTVRFVHNTVNADNPLTVDLGGTVQTVSSTEFTITTPSELTHNQLVFSGKNNVVSEVQVIEGDVTNIEYPFFEGMNDVQITDMTRNVNLFDINDTVSGYLNLNDGIDSPDHGNLTSNYIKVKPNTTYVYNHSGYDDGNNFNWTAMKFYKDNKGSTSTTLQDTTGTTLDKNGKAYHINKGRYTITGKTGYNTFQFTTPSDCEYIRIGSRGLSHDGAWATLYQLDNFSDSKFIARGKNLFNFENSGQMNGLTFSNNGANNYIVSGTCNGDNKDFYVVAKDKNNGTFTRLNSLPVGTTITVSKSSSVGRQVYLSIKQKDGSPTKYVQTYTTTNNDNVIHCFVRFMNGDTFDNAQLNLQIEIGSTATSYEPYKGVEVQQDIDIIPLTSDMFEQGKRERGLGMSMQQCSLTSNSARISGKTLIPVKSGSKYTVSGINTSVNHIWGDMYDKDGLVCYDSVLDLTGGISSGTGVFVPHDVHYLLLQVKNADESAITPSDLDSMNLILQEVPQEIVLRGIGDVKDELDLTRGEYIQRIGEVVLDGSKGSWAISTGTEVANNVTTLVHCYNAFKDAKPSDTTNTTSIVSLMTCDKYESKNIYGARHIQEGVTIHVNSKNADCTVFIRIKAKLTTTAEVLNYFSNNPFKMQYELATPIIHKVNLTNTKVIQSYATETHYETITPSDSLIPNITIPSTLNYDVAIKPSTEYTIRANTSDNLIVDLGGTTGTLSNGKVTLTTPTTLTHNEVKFSGTGKVKELMVIEGNEIKDNVPFFNGMKDVQMGGIKLVNIARGATCNNLVTASTNKTHFTYTGNGNNWGDIFFDKSLLKPNTLYTIYFNIVSNNSDAAEPIKISLGDDLNTWVNATGNGLVKKTFSSNNNLNNNFGIMFRPCSSGGTVVIQNPMIIEGDWTHLDEIPFIESEMIIDQPIIRSQGKNLLDLESKPFTIASEGTTFTKSGSTYTVATTVANSTPYDYIRRVWTVDNDKWLRDVAGKKLTLSVSSISCTNSNSMACIQLRIECMDGTKYYPGIHNGGKTVTFNMPINVKDLQMQVMTNNTGTALTEDAVLTISNIQLELGDTATSYKAYRHQTLYSNRVIGYEEDCYYQSGNGKKATNINFNSIIADVEGLSVAYITNGHSNFSFWDKDGVYISGQSFMDTNRYGDSNNNGFITVPSNAKYIKFPSGKTNEVPSDYTKATVTGELPLRSLSNGVCDTLNLVTGEYVQRVGEVVLDGSETWGLNNTNSKTTCYHLAKGHNSQLLSNMKFNTNSMLCNRYVQITQGAPNLSNNEGIFALSSYDAIYINSNIMSTSGSNDFKQYLSQNPITVQYELATPIVRKLGFTTKGNYREQVLDGSETWAMDAIDNDKTVRMTKKTTSPLQNALYNTPLFTDDYHVRAGGENHSTYEYITCIGNGVYINIYQSKVKELSVQGCTQWLSQNPIKVGYITSTQSSETYSNIHKPIFFNDVDVQYLPNNVDIQPELTYQARTRNSYVMDMMKANTKYSVKLLLNTGEFVPTIDGVNNPLVNGRTFTSPSTLTNKLLITPCIKELMIIEGDVTSKNLPYFKGILSSYHDVDEIELYSVNKNLFDMSKVKPFEGRGTYWWNTIVKENEVVSVRIGDINNGQFGAYIKLNVRPNSVYTLYIEMEKDGEPFNGQIYGYENGDLWGNGTFTGYANTPYHINTSHNAKYITIGFNYGKDLPIGTTLVSKNMRLYLGEESPVYIPHAHSTTLIEMPTRLETVKVVRPELTEGALEITSGAECASTTEWRSNFIPVQPSEFIKVRNGSEERLAHIDFYDINKNFISYSGVVNATYVPDNCYFIRFFMTKSNCSDLTITRQAWKPIQLNSLPNGVCDEIIMKPNSNKAQLVQRVGKVVLDGSEDISTDSAVMASNHTLNEISTYFRVNPTSFTLQKSPNSYNGQPNMLCDSLVVTSRQESQQTISNSICLYNDGFGMRPKNDVNNKLSLQAHLQQNPITVYYELATPIIHEIQLKGYPHVYEDGTVTLNTDTPHKTLVSYNVNQEQLINTQNETIIRHDQQIDDLYYYIEMYLEEIYQMELFRMKLELSL